MTTIQLSKLEIWCKMSYAERQQEWQRVGKKLGWIGRLLARWRLAYSREAALWNAWRILGIAERITN